MNPFKSITRLFNDMLYAGQYKAAEKEGNVFPGFRWIDHKRDYIHEDIPTAFHLDLMRGTVRLLYRLDGILHKLDTTVKDLKEEIRNYAISNHLQLSDYTKTPNSKGHTPLSDLVKSRQNIEQTIAIFEDRTQLHIKDPVRHIYNKRFMHDVEEALSGGGEGPETPGDRADQIIQLQKELASHDETLDEVPKTNGRDKGLIARLADGMFNKVLRN